MYIQVLKHQYVYVFLGLCISGYIHISEHIHYVSKTLSFLYKFYLIYFKIFWLILLFVMLVFFNLLCCMQFAVKLRMYCMAATVSTNHVLVHPHVHWQCRFAPTMSIDYVHMCPPYPLITGMCTDLCTSFEKMKSAPREWLYCPCCYVIYLSVDCICC